MLDPDEAPTPGEGQESVYRTGGPADNVEGRSPTEAECGERVSSASWKSAPRTMWPNGLADAAMRTTWRASQSC
eukprot:11428365-Alexandrium_andersonii.AAC.1